jgi:hypothetical protein
MKRVITNEGRLRMAALFMLLMLGVELLSLAWKHPLSFYLFTLAGGVFALLAIGSFLRSLVSPAATRGSRRPLDVVEEQEEEVAQVASR